MKRPDTLNRMHVACCITQDYLERSRGWLASSSILKRQKTWPICICRDFVMPNEELERYYHVDCYDYQTPACVMGNMVQHGSWLDRLPWIEDNDLFLLSDTDMIVQRDFDDAEWQRFQGYDDNTVGVVWNNFHPDDGWVDRAANTVRASVATSSECPNTSPMRNIAKPTSGLRNSYAPLPISMPTPRTRALSEERAHFADNRLFRSCTLQRRVTLMRATAML